MKHPKLPLAMQPEDELEEELDDELEAAEEDELDEPTVADEVALLDDPPPEDALLDDAPPVLLDGVYRELDAETAGFTALPHLSTREVGEVLETICKRIVKLLRRRGLLGDGERALEPEGEADEGPPR